MSAFEFGREASEQGIDSRFVAVVTEHEVGEGFAQLRGVTGQGIEIVVEMAISPGYLFRSVDCQPEYLLLRIASAHMAVLRLLIIIKSAVL